MSAPITIYVGNLSRSTTEEDLREAFAAHGEVVNVKIITEIVTDREPGRSRGFGFVDMSTEEEAVAAINGLNETDLNGQTIKVEKARPRGKKNR
jgi:RNA recognition motif-containing protein